MPGSRTRRPLPALFFLVVLVIFSAIVWWRVLERNNSVQADHKGSTHTSASPHASATPSCTTSPVTYPKPASVTVNVYNGSGRNGLAASTQTELQRRGFRVPNIGTSPNSFAGVAELQYGPSGKLAAQLLRLHFPGAAMKASSRADNTVDLVLGKAYRTMAAQSQVDAAVAAAARRC